MFAPKFRSWLTDEERFAEAQEWRINLAADAALKEISEMAKAAMLPEQDERSREVSPLDRLYKRWLSNGLYPSSEQARNLSSWQVPDQLQNSAYPASGHSTGLGLESAPLSALFGGWRNL